jgi:hypothetical protein
VTLIEGFQCLSDGAVERLSHDWRERISDLLRRFGLASSELVAVWEALEKAQFPRCVATCASVMVGCCSTGRDTSLQERLRVVWCPRLLGTFGLMVVIVCWAQSKSLDGSQSIANIVERLQSATKRTMRGVREWW